MTDLEQRKKTAELQILLCDDDRDFLERLTKVVENVTGEIPSPVRISSFAGPAGISDYVLQGTDIAILDIDFAGNTLSGLDIARRIRKKRSDAVILFLTNYVEYAPEGYEVQAFRYCLKCDMDRKLPEYLNQAIERFTQARKCLKISSFGELITIPLDTILYLESNHHQVVVHAQTSAGKKTYTYYSSLSGLEEELEKQGFLRTHKSYLVNMRWIKSFQFEGLTLTDGTSLRVSGQSYAALKREFLLWKGRF